MTLLVHRDQKCFCEVSDSLPAWRCLKVEIDKYILIPFVVSLYSFGTKIGTDNALLVSEKQKKSKLGKWRPKYEIYDNNKNKTS